jgi:CysZ protein
VKHFIMFKPITASLQGFSDLFSATLSKLVLLSMGIAATLLGGAVWAVIRFIVPMIPDWQGRFSAAAEATSRGAAIFLAFVMALVLWPIVAMIVSGLFFDVAADRLEAKILPASQRGKPPPALDGLLVGLRFAGVSIPLNLLALPLYFIPGLNLLVAIGLNAFLLSRENYMLAALRYGPFDNARQELRAHRGPVFVAALPGAALCIIPFVSFIVPLWMLATMVRLRASHHPLTQNSGTLEDAAA